MLAILLVGIIISCNPSKPHNGESASSQAQTELSGERPDIRDIAGSETDRLTLNEESVYGQFSPPEGILSVPVELRPGAFLSTRIGATCAFSTPSDDLIIRIEYVPESGEPQSLLETSGDQSKACLREWINLDLPIPNPTGSEGGRIKFSVAGSLKERPLFKLMWGHPVIHYPAERKHRNVLLIGVDTLRADAISPLGGRPEVTPNIQIFSDSAIVFSQTRSQCPWTMPSFASMLTGRLPSVIGATIKTITVPDSATTLPEILMNAGYATETICSNSWIGYKDSGFQQGNEGMWYRFDARAGVVADKALEFIERSQDRDWFCFVHFNDPHASYNPERRFVQRLADPNYRGDINPPFRPPGEWKNGTVVPSAGDLKRVRELYDCEVAAVDEAVGRLLAAVGDDTLVVFASDHGEEFYEHGGFEHAQSQFEELIHVPLIVRGPGFDPGARIDTPIGNTDILPTILTYAGISRPVETIGTPLQEIIAGLADENRVFYGEDNMWSPLTRYAYQAPYKCIVSFQTGESRLYDLTSDPSEKSDFHEQNPEIAAALTSRILRAMTPYPTIWGIWITSSDSPRNLTVIIKTSGILENPIGFNLEPNDKIDVLDNNLTLTITSPTDGSGGFKFIQFEPADKAAQIEVSVLVDGKIDPACLYSGSNLVPIPYGTVSLNPSDFLSPSPLPLVPDSLREACIVGFVTGVDAMVEAPTMSAETIEQLKALGYVNPGGTRAD